MVTVGPPGTGASLPSIGDLVTVAEVDTVVRLDGPGGLLADLVLTGDVASAVEDVLAASRGPSGAGFFVVGPFGSGKSHFLSAMGELLTGAGQVPSSWAAALREAASAARRSLPVRVPLVDYRAEAALEDVVYTPAWRALGREDTGRGCGQARVLGRRAGRGHGQRLPGPRAPAGRGERVAPGRARPGVDGGSALPPVPRRMVEDRPAIVVAALQDNIEEVANVSEPAS